MKAHHTPETRQDPCPGNITKHPNRQSQFFAIGVSRIQLSVGFQAKMGINPKYGDNPHIWGFRLVFVHNELLGLSP